MAVMNLVQSINNSLSQEMETNNNIVLLGEDIGINGGVFRVTEGLLAKFGSDRVIDTPLSEVAIIGVSIGMALYGLRPIPEIQFADFVYPALDQIISELSKMRYRSGGEFSTPVIVRMPYGGGIRGGQYHSQSPEAYFAHTPGLKVVIPSNPYDAKGLLASCLNQNDPVIFMEPKRIYRTTKQEVPEEKYTVPLSVAKVVRTGKDITILCYGAMVDVCEKASEMAQEHDIDVEIIDIRTLIPLDEETILKSVAKTGRVVIVQEAPKTCGYGAELAAIIAERAIEYLEGPIVRVAGFDTPFPYSLEHVYMPHPQRVLNAIKRVVEF